MKERYRLRHPSLQGTLGPYSLEQLRQAIAAQSLPADSRVLPVDAADEAANWRALHELLGLPSPPPGAPLPRAASATSLTAAGERRHAVRRSTAYPALRTLILLLAAVGIVINLALMVLPTSVTSFIGFWPPQPFAAIAIAVVVAGAGMLLAVLDIADCSLRRDARDHD